MFSIFAKQMGFFLLEAKKRDTYYIYSLKKKIKI